MNHFSKTIASGLLLLALPLATTAQTHLKRAFDDFARNNSANVQKEFYQNKDPETGKKTAQCDIYRFKIPGRQGQSIVGQLKEAFEQDRDEAEGSRQGRLYVHRVVRGQRMQNGVRLQNGC